MTRSDKILSLPRCLVVAVAVSHFPSANAAPLFSYSARELPPDILSSVVTSVSDSGEMYGAIDYYSAWGGGLLVRYNVQGQIAWQVPFDSDYLPFFQPLGASEEGVFFGYYSTESFPWGQAATISESYGLQLRPRIPNSTSTYVRGSSPSGNWLVGDQNFVGSGGMGVIFGPGNSYFLSDTFYGVDATDKGLVVGIDANTARPATWTQATGVQLLPELPNGLDSAIAVDVTDSGLIHVSAPTNPLDPYARRHFIYDRGSYLPLETVPGDRIDVLAINDQGWAVGSDEQAALLWIDGEMYRLEDLVVGLPPNVSLWAATAINNHGQIGVEGTDGTFLVDGEPAPYTVLLTPIVPEPSSLSLFVAASALVRHRRRRRGCD